LPKPPFTITKTAVATQTRKFQAKWAVEHIAVLGYKPYELTEEEKESLSPDEQETWKVLKTTEVLDLEQEIMQTMSADIAKEIDTEIIKVLLGGTSTK
jgi:hypothetical protein